jgi:putative oxidoreductase
LSLFRAVFGLLFAAHGSSSLFAWPVTYGHAPATGAWPDWWAAVIELVTGLLILVGLFTRIAAFFASGAMAYAYFTVHQPLALWPIDPAQKGEASVLYCFAFFLLVFTGGGVYALDARRRGGTSTRSRIGR